MRTSYASLFTSIRSPSRIVGFMEPVGTTFQSASALRKMTIKIMKSARPLYSRHALIRPLFISSLLGFASISSVIFTVSTCQPPGQQAEGDGDTRQEGPEPGKSFRVGYLRGVRHVAKRRQTRERD